MVSKVLPSPGPSLPRPRPTSPITYCYHFFDFSLHLDSDYSYLQASPPDNDISNEYSHLDRKPPHHLPAVLCVLTPPLSVSCASNENTVPNKLKPGDHDDDDNYSHLSH